MIFDLQFSSLAWPPSFTALDSYFSTFVVREHACFASSLAYFLSPCGGISFIHSLLLYFSTSLVLFGCQGFLLSLKKHWTERTVTSWHVALALGI